MTNLNGKTVVVTGGSRGQGAATVERFAEAGATVFFGDVLEEEGAALTNRLSSLPVYFIPTDVSDEEAWANLVSRAMETGHIDALINNAGISFASPLLDTNRDDFDNMLSINLIGPFLGMKAVIPFMIEAGKGSIVNVCSINALRGGADTSSYNASKWGLLGMSKSVALECADKGIRVNAVLPGAIDTPMLNPEGIPAVAEAVAREFRIGMGRVGKPEEVAAASLFLASDEASYISGAEIAVDGTWSAGVYLSSDRFSS